MWSMYHEQNWQTKTLTDCTTPSPPLLAGDLVAVLPANRLYTEFPRGLARAIVSPLSFFLLRNICLKVARSSYEEASDS